MNQIVVREFVEFLNIYGSDKILEGEYAGEYMIDYGWNGIVQKGKIWKVYEDKHDKYDKYPVMRVSWYGANQFCKFRNGQLPTEAQWEYAARSAGKDYKYSWGNEEPTTKQVANIADRSYGNEYKDNFELNYIEHLHHLGQ